MVIMGFSRLKDGDIGGPKESVLESIPRDRFSRACINPGCFVIIDGEKLLMHDHVFEMKLRINFLLNSPYIKSQYFKR